MKDEEIIDNEKSTEEKESIIKREDRFNPIELSSGELHVEPDMIYVDSDEDGDALPSKDVVKKLREELKTLRKEKEEYLTGWQRAKADYVNLQKELDLARINISILTKEKMVEKLLPSLDSFEMAFSNKEHWEKIDKDWQNGITSIYQQLTSGLSEAGIEKIDQIGIPFDPNVHQSISIVATEDQTKDHTVEKVLQVGYKIGERVIRPAKVTIFEYKK
ncbi:MAG: Protein GrpE [Candidatus Nomurabacteria bacterium GW2011_GWF2_35_66]|uniref:Protein GrpE n=1 Tax=Candidatus Nomurabacteria bacterium GW2011_GWE1_35_16 TaxID=1618761 RepID=A0A0G0DU57_9BACT|nr:MAG: Protein GrpE [Candidatus Nomurabacteria bacterium GW2011_GWF1_34_20]KKP63354.1 MAG: Protein GrpE [Candidatus Nomurabacteria bacterium GW2011_GWE2_34_25]KKP66545.1 MAG: Protein GrpE [Candidatus Nomurabacteria bacterium GW2011_GWE1_35_16]KKP83591.1 MAG: Protein GrpE [Candidatus Nomurabacteria bacterium GW2011_GWF2_35_66]HAE36853.1 nucleotide exchange factor GrpE [Candidatus Nomurabacteria bacterium]